ncbi:MAG: hypothetical protein GTN89_09970 [Acidobacteria bacterium]|nr:hypothetical protein [Acidobacteriota bacterium]NIQ30681.1 hypothetical protein [Acidobacteriota bacterium]NIQ85639.1 hypothetical protein [Acidobacteriota bacterium]
MGHLREAGLDARKVNVQNLDAVKRERGVSSTLASCHTAVVDGYVVEGHVPADVVRKLLDERPDIVGIAVPDMPLGSPGMEVPGRPAESYDVLAFDQHGQVFVFASR